MELNTFVKRLIIQAPGTRCFTRFHLNPKKVETKDPFTREIKTVQFRNPLRFQIWIMVEANAGHKRTYHSLKQGTFTEGEDSVQLISSLWSLVVYKSKHYLYYQKQLEGGQLYWAYTFSKGSLLEIYHHHPYFKPFPWNLLELIKPLITPTRKLDRFTIVTIFVVTKQSS